MKTLTRALQVGLEVVLLMAAFVLAYSLRFDFDIPQGEITKLYSHITLVVIFEFFALRAFGAHRFIWRYTSTRDARHIGAALISVTALLLIARSMHSVLPTAVIVPISIAILNLFIASVSILGIRMLRREIYERSNARKGPVSLRKPVILVGAGQAGVMTLAEVRRRGDLDIDVKAFVDDDITKHGATINGVKVVGSTKDLPDLVRNLKIEQVIISIAQASRTDFQKILKICEEAHVKVRTIPSMYELLQGNVTVSRLRNVEVEDLLGRPAVSIEPESIMGFLKNKTVMVTGAGGSIGSELVRQACRSGIHKIVLVERSEPALFQIEQEVSNEVPKAKISATVADVTDRQRMTNLFERFKPDIVLHAAAHKHVPLMESNASEALKNNVLGTHLVADLAGRHGAEAFVLISTDKAVFPTSIMGATKRLAELVVQDLDAKYGTRYVSVRFGNVIGSTGSVIPTFREQIKRGGPVTVTHPEMTRYFMTIPEASQLVLQAGAIGLGGEIMVLDMGNPVRILDLARHTIKLSGLRPEIDIEIKFTGIRPGEKLAEILESDAERLDKTIHPKIFVATIANPLANRICALITRIRELCDSENELEIRRLISHWLPEAKLSTRQHISSETQATQPPRVRHQVAA